MVSSSASTAASPKPSAENPNAAAHGEPFPAMPIATPSSPASLPTTTAPASNASATSLPSKPWPISRDQTRSQGRRQRGRRPLHRRAKHPWREFGAAEIKALALGRLTRGGLEHQI